MQRFPASIVPDSTQKRPALGGLRAWPALALLLALMLARGVAAQAQENLQLRLSLPGNETPTAPLQRIDGTLFMEAEDFERILQAIEPRAVLQRHDPSGVIGARVRETGFALYRDQARIMLNGELSETEFALRWDQDRVLIPISSLMPVLQSWPEIGSNIEALLLPQSTYATPVPLPPTAPGSPVSERPAAESENLLLPRAVAPEFPEPREVLDADPRTRLEMAPERIESRLARRLEPLAGRRLILIDPQPPRSLRITTGDDSGAPPEVKTISMGPDLTLRLALQLRRLLIAEGFEVELLREDAEFLERGQREARVAASEALALLSLRFDASTQPEQRGYRMLSTHQAVDPLGRRYAERHELAERLPPECQYLPFQEASLFLAHFLDQALADTAILPPAGKATGLAPLHLLQRAPMPSTMLVLGYATHSGDLAALRDEKNLEALAHAIAVATVRFAKWIETRYEYR